MPVIRRILFSFFLFLCATIYSQKAIFLHHSTGAGVYSQGNVAAWISDYNSSNGTNYELSERSYPNTPYPWQNYPYDYWHLWVDRNCDNSDKDIACLDKLAQDYHLIIFKHCFPGAQIKADDGSPSVESELKTLANYKLQYRALRELMDSYPDKKFIVWTLVPLHRLGTSPGNALRARKFVNWVKTSWLTEDGSSHPNIYIFDFFGYAAESNPEPSNGQVNCLKYEYEQSHSNSDSHPNLLANQTMGPIFAQFIVNTIEDSQPVHIPVSSIQIDLENGGREIFTGDHIQFEAEVLPSNASDKRIRWSVTNETGSASITQDGMLTAVSEGTVTVSASAQDGSGKSGNMQITVIKKDVEVNEIQISSIGGISVVLTGEILQLAAKVLPSDAENKNVIWSVNNLTGTAVINQEGLLTAMLEGTVEVVVTALDGSGVSESLQITIADEIILVSTIEVRSVSGDSDLPVGRTLQMNVEIQPQNATSKDVIWRVNDLSGDAGITQSGLLVGFAAGSVEVIAITRDGSGKRDTVGINVIESTVVGMDENRNRLPGVHLYPNPSSGFFTLEIEEVKVDLIQIIDLSGAIIKEILTEPGKEIYMLDLSDKPQGSYFVRIKSDIEYAIMPIIISH